MANLADDDLLLVQRTSAGISTNYSITGSALKEDLGGPDGLITPPVAVLTPLNGAGLNDGQSYTPMSSAYVSTDTTPIRYRWFPELITTISGGSWVDENNLFNGSGAIHAELTGAADSVSQFVFTPHPGWIDGETDCYVYGTAGGIIEILDDAGTVLRTYSYLSSPGDYAVGIVRSDQKIRFTSNGVNESIYVAAIGGLDGGAVDYVIPGRVAFEFTDDTDLDKMVAPIIQTDENGNVKVPTTSTVDSTTTIPGVNKGMEMSFVGNGNSATYAGSNNTYALAPPLGARMLWAKSDTNNEPIIADNVVLNGNYLETSNSNSYSIGGPDLQENQSVYPVNNKWNANGSNNYIVEISVAPKILDIVTWTGDNTSLREIPHNLGTKPGMIIIKRYDSSVDWAVWHKDLAAGEHLTLNTDSGSTNFGYFPSEPTSDAFYVSNATAVNNSYNYVAYVFAADTPGKVKCGTYTGNGGNQFIYPGFAPGFVLIKRHNASSDWIAVTKQTDNNYKYWYPNRNEYGLVGDSGAYVGLSNNNFALNGGHADWNSNGSEYIYLAVASNLTGPNSTQLNLLSGQDLEYFTTGTQITSNAAASGSNISFGSLTYSGTSQLWMRQPSVGGDTSWYDIRSRTGNKWLTWIKKTSSSASHHFFDSERSLNMPLYSDYSQAEAYVTSNYIVPYDSGAGYRVGHGDRVNQSGHNYISWNFLAAPQFFDVQKYAGTGSVRTIQHDLGVEPGCIIIKRLDADNDWRVYHSELTSASYQLYLNHNLGENSAGPVFNSTDPTSSEFTVGSDTAVNGSGGSYIAYLFAKDTPYVKCGTYTGAGAGTYVNTGFRPRWMMIKRTDSSGSWIILDKKLSNKYVMANKTDAELSFSWYFDFDGVSLGDSYPDVNGPLGDFVYVAIADEIGGHPPAPPSTSTVTETPDPNTAQMVVNAESFDVGATASAPALEASITSVAGSDGNKLLVDSTTGTWMPGLYAKGSETTINAPGPDEITFTSQNQGTPTFSGVDATLASRTWTLESGTTATGPWTLVDTYSDFGVLNTQTGATPWTENKPTLQPNTYYRIKVQYNSTNAESVESVYNTFKTGDA